MGGQPDELRGSPLQQAWAQQIESVSASLSVDPSRGLSEAEARSRLIAHGENRLQETRSKSPLAILANQFESLIVVLLAVAAAVSFLFGEVPEGIAIVVVIGINSAIGFATELRAVRSMEALRRLGLVSTRLRRGGQVLEVPAEQIVPGDVVIVEGGDVVTADMRIAVASKLQADESTLTGESLPVEKNAQILDAGTILAERTNMLYKGTAVTRGSGEAIVTATGMRTELGQISSLVEEAKEEVTPLERRLDALGRRLIWATLLIVALVAAVGIISGKAVLLMIQTAIALAVATVPEGLPIVATIALARGMVRMARRNALINQLSAVETLGGTTIICTDKTGTLTQNKLTVSRYVTSDGEVHVCPEEVAGSWFETSGSLIDPSETELLREAIQLGVLCNNASLRPDDIEGEQGVGDPLEVALLSAGAKAGVLRGELVEKFELRKVGEVAFDSDTKMMATYHEQRPLLLVAVKGAPEIVLKACKSIRTQRGTVPLEESYRRRILDHNLRMGEEGLRVLALATKTVKDLSTPPYEDLVFVALVGLRDPPRLDVRASIGSCRTAGISVVMATGDQAVTARNVAIEVGLVGEKESEAVMGDELKSPDLLSSEERYRLLRARIFARVSPRQKLDLISLHQADGQVVAMTGDGVNDAPALKKADIGVAMGLRGTQVAREAADMVLKDDSFSTIVAAVEQGRIIFDNIKKVVFFLLSCNLSEIMVVALASFLNAPLPLLPLQILFLNLVTDVFPALAMGTGEGDPSIMSRHPRDPKEPILPRGDWVRIFGFSLVMTASVLLALAIASFWLGFEERQAVTVSFLTLAFAQLWHVFNMRDRGSGVVRNEITRNRYVWLSLGLCTVLLYSAVGITGLATVLRTEPIGASGWLLVGGMSSVTLIAGHAHRSLFAR